MNVSLAEINLIAFALALIILYNISPKFKYYLKFFIWYLTCALSSIVLFPILCLRPRNVRNYCLVGALCKLASPLIGIKWTLRGEEYLSQDKAFIIVANHQNSLDILGMFTYWNVMGKCTAIAKIEMLYMFPYGPTAWMCGIIYISRLRGDKSKKIMNEAAEALKKDKVKLWIYPEGTRHYDGKIHDFKKGAFHLAVNFQIPILPVVFNKYYFIDSKKKQFDSGRMIMTALPPVSTEGKTMEDLDDLIRETKEKMTLVFDEVNSEVLTSNQS